MESSSKLILMMSMLVSVVGAAAEPLVPCYFLFGDSLVDNGNNNDVVNTTDRADFVPYGIDLPSVPRGRFTNGHNVDDFLAEFLGFKELMPPFLTAKGNEILRGVNYASGGAGILDETGNTEGVIPLRRQIKNHLRTIVAMTKILGLSETQSCLKKSIYAINIGSNDYLVNYFNPTLYPTSSIYTPAQFAKVLVAEYSELIQMLYLNGARKVALTGLGKLGCIPVLMNGTLCEETVNAVAALFNTELLSLVKYLNEKFPDAKFTYITTISNTSLALTDAIPNYGPCCEIGSGGELCLGNGTVCANRTEYVFWDAVHPTETVNLIYANIVYNSTSSSDVYPYNIRQLAEATVSDEPVKISVLEMRNVKPDGEMGVAAA